MQRITEEDFKANIIELATTLGWKVHHDRPALDPRQGFEWRTALEGDAGFPDLVLAKAGRIIFAELKTELGKTSSLQAEWLEHLAGIHWPPASSSSTTITIEGEALTELTIAVWRPSDIQDIAKLLGPRRHHHMLEEAFDGR
jgi:hypothetical protein